MHPPENLRGIIAMLLAVALFSLMDAQLKLLAAHYGPMQVSFLRGATSLPFVLLPIMLRGRLARLRPVNVRLHLLRGALSVLMLASFVYAVRESSLATTYSIFMCAPLVVAALSVPVLGERVARAQWVAIAVGLGVFLRFRYHAVNFALVQVGAGGNSNFLFFTSSFVFSGNM